ncbi:ATP-binding cassette domain-containing protein [Aerosakkonemataceae cyanobacterium BLCC-F154]|uniref:histidine kinase n=1 Tax=Floridaenema fluviatile BLCC-F154 TaxID=3153640 RepID=A0ABV4Y8H4_9CYAN
MSKSNLLIKFARRYPIWIIFTIILGFSGALFNGVGTALIVPILLNVLGQQVELKGAPPLIQKIITPFDNLPSQYRLLAMAGVILLVIILKNLANYIGSLVSSSLTRKLAADMREAGLQMLLEVDLDFYAKMKVGDLINRLGGEIARAVGTIGTIIRIVTISITVLVFVALLLIISWQLTIASTFLLATVALINQVSIYRARIFGKQLSEMSKSYSIRVLEVLNGIRLVKATANEKREYELLQNLIRIREKADFQSQVNDAAIAPISEVTGIFALMIIVILGRAFFINQIQAVSAVILTYLLVLFRLLPYITQLNNARSQLANSSASVEIVADFLRRDNKPFIKNGSLPYKALEKGIDFQKVFFKYPGHEDFVLKNINLFLPRGTTLALVGGSGAGKSTLVDLVPRFYDSTTGSITLDGIDIRDYDVKSLRKAMGIVSQDTYLFNDSVRNNIAYGNQNATEEEVISAAKRANAYEFITKLPQGFDTVIGDRGVLLSGGQRQRLAIARALLQDPDILILDEATSALDTVSERLVQAAIEDLSRDRTTLVIAHRLSTVQKADQIAVLDKGIVVEIGTHQELVNKGGYYSRLYSMQFSESPEVVFAHNEAIREQVSYEVRTLLNSMIGSLRLLADNMVDTPEEQRELIEESYSSAISLFNSIESFENSSKLPIK